MNGGGIRGVGEGETKRQRERESEERVGRREGSIPMIIESSDVPQQWLQVSYVAVPNIVLERLNGRVVFLRVNTRET